MPPVRRRLPPAPRVLLTDAPRGTPSGPPHAPHVTVRTYHGGRAYLSVLPAGHPGRPAARAHPPRWRTPALALMALALACAAVAAVAFLHVVAATLAAVAATLLLGALWVAVTDRAAEPADERVAEPRADTSPRASARSPAAWALLALTAGPGTLVAPAALHAQRSAGEVLAGLSVAGGGDVRGAARREGFGRSLLAAYDVLRVGETLPLTVRVTGTLLARNAADGSGVRYGGGGLDAMLTLRPSGPVRPYLLAGVGTYRLRNATPARTRTTEALVGGGGVLVPLGAASLFAEGRYTAFMGPGGGGYVPVVVGLRLGKL